MTETAPVSSGSLEIANVPVRYSVRGDGPPIVLLCTLEGIWTAQARALSRHYQVVTYDMRGFGRSTNSNRYYPGNEDHADDLAAIIDHLGLHRPMVVGLSHGGIVLQYFARRYAHKVSALMYVATLAKPIGQTRLILSLLKSFLDEYRDDQFWHVLRTFLFSEPNFDTFIAREASLKRLMFNQFTAQCLNNIYTAALFHDSTPWLPEIKAPALVVGGKEDVLFPPAQTALLNHSLGNSRMVLLDRVAHLPPVEAPQVFNQLVSDYYRTVLE